MHIKEARPTEKKKRAMGAPARASSKTAMVVVVVVVVRATRSHRRRAENAPDDDVREDVVRNLVRDIRAKVVMRREDQHSGGANETKSDETKKARSMLEELAEHLRTGVVFGGMFSSLPFIEHKMQPCFQTFSHLFLGETSTIHATARTSSSSRDKNEVVNARSSSSVNDSFLEDEKV